MGGEEYNWRPGEVLREKHVLLLLRIRHGVLFCYSTVCASLFVALRCLPVDAGSERGTSAPRLDDD